VIIGIGADLIEISRIAAVLERHPERFRQRCFTDGERKYCDAKAHAAQHYAGRFAAKEACMKALGTGVRGVGWREIEVVRWPGRAPTLTLHDRALARFQTIGAAYVHVSITHSRDLAQAVVVVEGPAPEIRDEA